MSRHRAHRPVRPGRAFHGGNPGRPTAGCVRLPDDEAKAFFDALVPGDAVEILP